MKGRVDFSAPIADGSITFPEFSLKPPHAQCSSVQLACPDGRKITGCVWVHGVPTHEDGIQLAQQIFESLLTRLAYSQDLIASLSTLTSSAFEPETPSSGTDLTPGTGSLVLTGYAPRVMRSVDTLPLQELLEAPVATDTHQISQFRSSCIATGPVEEYMLLFRLLLELVGDEQKFVDNFIQKCDSSLIKTPRTDNPKKFETIYSRLRNELAHHREGVDYNKTKLLMAQHIGGLRKIVRAAIAERSTVDNF